MVDIENLLDEVELSYEIDDDGDYNVVMSLDDEEDGRTQLVIVSGQAQQAVEDGEDFVHVWSKAADISDIPTSDFKELMADSSQLGAGGWEIAGDNLIFTVKTLAAGLDSESLNEIIDFVASTADQKELEYSDEDVN